MSDLISRQALCEYALNQKGKCVTPNDIMRFPSAQQDRKKGKWFEVDPHMVICPFCKHASSRRNYCAECGADMRGESDD